MVVIVTLFKSCMQCFWRFVSRLAMFVMVLFFIFNAVTFHHNIINLLRLFASDKYLYKIISQCCHKIFVAVFHCTNQGWANVFDRRLHCASLFPRWTTFINIK